MTTTTPSCLKNAGLMGHKFAIIRDDELKSEVVSAIAARIRARGTDQVWTRAGSKWTRVC